MMVSRSQDVYKGPKIMVDLVQFLYDSLVFLTYHKEYASLDEYLLLIVQYPTLRRHPTFMHNIRGLLVENLA